MDKIGDPNGFTLFETLVALAILAAITSVYISVRPTPSPQLKTDRAVGTLAAVIAGRRLDAVRSGKVVTFKLPYDACDGSTETVTIFADGTANDQPFCVLVEGQSVSMSLDPFTAKIIMGIGE